MIISAARMITGDGRTVLQDHGVLVNSQGRLSAIAPTASLLAACPNQEHIAFPQGTLIPGLIDLHAHLTVPMSSADPHLHSDYTQAYLALEQCRRAFSRGVTTVRSLCCRPGLEDALRHAGAHLLPIPRLVSSGRGICMTGGHGHDLGPGVEEVDGPEALRRAVRTRVREGHRWIKVLTSHRSERPEFTQEELDALTDEGHRLGCRLAVHAGTRTAVDMCIRAGFDTIEHGTFMTVEQAAQMRSKGIVWVPTIIAYSSAYQQMRPAGDPQAPSPALRYFQQADAAYRDGFLARVQTGVAIAAGTDLCVDGFTDLNIPRELQYYTDYGMDPLSAIACATSVGAEVLGLGGVTGRLAPGLEANMILVEGDPSRDIRALSQVRRVFLSGKTVWQWDERGEGPQLPV